MKLSILIPTIVGREKQLKQLIAMLSAQTGIANYWMHESADWVNSGRDENVEIITLCDKAIMSIGEKRNKLLKMSHGKYVAFIDDDDSISEDYIELLINATDSGCDCASLKGEITIDGGKPEIFEHSLKYNEWKTNPEGSEIRYERYPNHLSLIRSSIAKQFKFPEKNHGEDHDWSKQIHESGLLKTEYYIPEIIYYYNYISNK